MKKAKVKTRWQKVNDIVLLLHIVFPMWIVTFLYTYAIADMLLLIAVIPSLSVGIIYKLVQKYNKGKWVLYTARAVAILGIIVYYTPMVILIKFTRTKQFYQLKRLTYTHGVYGDNAERYESLLPDKLPDDCSEYYFRTQGTIPAQDYHASSYLMFYTDSATLDAYATYYGALDCVRLENSSESSDAQNDIQWFCNQMQISKDDLGDAVLYWFDDYYPKGVMLDYDTGFVAILT